MSSSNLVETTMTLSTVDVVAVEENVVADAEIEATTELAFGTSTVPNPKFKTSLCRNFLSNHQSR